VLRHPFNWKRLSLAGALAYEADGSDAHLVFELRPGAYNDETLIEFLSELNDIEQRRLLLIRDGLPAHRSRRMINWVRNQRATAGLCAGPQSPRASLGQPEISGTRQPVLQYDR
jgi:hypothetical protein